MSYPIVVLNLPALTSILIGTGTGTDSYYFKQNSNLPNGFQDVPVYIHQEMRLKLQVHWTWIRC